MPVTITAQAPPAVKARAPKAPGTANNLTRKAAERAEGLDGIGQLLAAGLLFASQPADAGAINKHWHPVSVEVARLADDNPRIAEALDSLNKVGPYTGLIMAVLPLLLQIAVNHGRIPADNIAKLGVVPKAQLEAEMRVLMLEAEMHAMQVQMEAEEQKRAVEAQFRAMTEAMSAREDTVGD